MNRRNFLFGAGWGAAAAAVPASVAGAECAGAKNDSRFNVKDFGAKGVDLSGVTTAVNVQLGFAADETELDLAKVYPDAWKPGVVGTRWANVETTVESDADKTVRFYYSNDWFGELRVNGKPVELKTSAARWTQTVSFDADLAAGSHEVRLFNDKSSVPAVVRMTVSMGTEQPKN